MQSSAVLSFRAWTTKIHGKIHGPLPLNPRESQQLLNILTTSFQRHLDESHPTANTDRSHRAYSADGAAAVRPKPAPPSTPQSAFASANDHIASLLSNPLLSAKKTSGKRLSGTSLLYTDPIRWLRQRLPNNRLLEDIGMCLRTFWKPGCDDHKAALSTMEVFDWAAEQRNVDVRSLVFDRQITNKLFKSIVITGRHDVVRHWTETLFRLDDKARSSTLHLYITHLTHHLRRSKHVEPLRVAVEAVMKEYSLHGLLRELPGLYSLLNAILREPGAVQKLPPELYDRFASVLRSGTLADALNVEAALRLGHPQHPSTDAALSYIKSGEMHRDLDKQPSLSFRHYCVRLCLALARKLLAKENTADAEVILRFTHSNFPVELGLRTLGKNEKKVDEGLNVLRLHNLELGSLV